jgi:hypothetical protein
MIISSIKFIFFIDGLSRSSVDSIKGLLLSKIPIPSKKSFSDISSIMIWSLFLKWHPLKLPMFSAIFLAKSKYSCFIFILNIISSKDLFLLKKQWL